MRFISTSHSHWPIFTTLCKMTDADKVMNPQYFGSNLAQIGHFNFTVTNISGYNTRL